MSMALVLLLTTACSKADASATTMRLLQKEGIIHLFSGGKEKTVTDELKLESGDNLQTEAASKVSVSLDDHKIVTLDENSSADFKQEGKALSLFLNEGTIFFQVNEKLAEDESFDISTSNTICGIRGTSGLVTTNDQGHHAVYVTSGVVHITGINPLTGERKEIEVKAGQSVQIWHYNDRETDTVEFEAKPFSPESLPAFALNAILNDSANLQQVLDATGWTESQLRAAYETVSALEAEGVIWGSGTDNDSDGDGDGNGGSGNDTTAGGNGNTAGGKEGEGEGKEDGDGDGDGTGGDDDGGNGNDGDGDGDGNDGNDGNGNGGNGNGNGNDGNGNGQNPQIPDGTVTPPADGNPQSLLNEDGLIIMPGGIPFDPSFYAQYPDMKDHANDPEYLYQHYLEHGMSEGRSPNADAEAKRREAELQNPPPPQIPPDEWEAFAAAQEAADEEETRRRLEEEYAYEQYLYWLEHHESEDEEEEEDIIISVSPGSATLSASNPRLIVSASVKGTNAEVDWSGSGPISYEPVYGEPNACEVVMNLFADPDNTSRTATITATVDGHSATCRITIVG